MRSGAALCGQDAQHAVEVKLHHIRRGKVFSHQNAGVGGFRGVGRSCGKMLAQAQAHGADILSTVAQVGIIHAPEESAQLFHSEAQGPGGGNAFVFYARQGGIEQFGITGHFHLCGNDVTVFGQIFRHIVHCGLQRGAHACSRGAQRFLLGRDFGGRDVPLFILPQLVHEARPANGNAGRNGSAEKYRAGHVSPAWC